MRRVADTDYLPTSTNGSGLHSFGMTVSQPNLAISVPVSMPVIGGPQVSPIPMGGPHIGAPFHLGVHRAIVVFCLVPCLMRRQDKVEMVIMMAMVELLDQELHRHNHRGTTTFNLGIKPKDPPVFYGRANEDVSTWVAKLF